MNGARSTTLAAVLAVSCCALVACAPSSPAPSPTPAAANVPSSSPSAPATPGAPAAPVEEGVPDVSANTDTGADVGADAVEAAIAAVTAYCRPGVSEGEWMAGLSPHLTDSAVLAYGTVDPATVPCTSYLGSASIRDGDEAFTFRVNVPTDAGIYEAYVTRAATSDPWRVERMAPPQ